MAAYTTQAELIERYGSRALIELTDDDGDGQIDAAVVDRAIADASATIDGYLAARYALPLAAVPPLLVTIAAAIAFYQLHRHGAPEKVAKDYDDARRLLADISRGTVKLDLAGAEPAASSDGPQVEGPARIFSRDSLGGY